ncbi:MAG: hypothetical protein ACKERG_00905 [Candidatus Hodgkinia cicadicola]
MRFVFIDMIQARILVKLDTTSEWASKTKKLGKKSSFKCCRYETLRFERKERLELRIRK